MSAFDDHIAQAKKNLLFLESINQKVDNCFDWQVTVAFYTALHLVNAHLAKYNLVYRRHSKVKLALNPEMNLSVTKVGEDEYVSYVILQNLSRRSRYLVNEKKPDSEEFVALLTFDKHLAKALKHLDRLIYYFNSLFGLDIKHIEVQCNGLIKKEDVKCMKVVG